MCMGQWKYDAIEFKETKRDSHDKQQKDRLRKYSQTHYEQCKSGQIQEHQVAWSAY